MENLMEIKDLHVEFASGKRVVHAVNGISLSLRKGETLGLVGETGAGKTTTALSIINLVPKPAGRITGGEILFEGEDLLKKSQQEMRHIRGNKISMIFQDPMTSLNPVFTVGDQISESLHLHTKLSNMESVQRAREMLEQVGIPGGRYHEYPHQFSGGMKQRVVIAIAMICNPDVIIADEPTTALDVTIQAQIMELMKSLQINDHKSIILITHNMGLVAEMADEVCVMYMGRVVEFGTLEDIFEHPSHPYTEALLRSVPVLGLAEGQELETIPGATPNPADLGAGCEFADRCPHCHARCREKDIPRYEVSPGHYVRCLKYDSFQEVV